MRSTKTKIRLWVLGAALTLVAVSCGASSSTAEASGAAAPTSSADEATTEGSPGDGEDPAVAGGASGEEIQPEVRSISSAVGGEVSGEGWLLPAGAWTSSKVGTPISFRTDRDLTIIDNTEALISFGPLGFTFADFDTFLVARFDGMAIPAEEEPEVLDLPVDVGEFFQSASHLDLVDIGTMVLAGDTATWWEVAANPDHEYVSQCQYGEACTVSMLHPGFGPFQLGEGIDYRFRVAELPLAPNGERLFLWMQARTEVFDDLWTVAEATLSTIRYQGPVTEESSYDLAAGAAFAQVDPGPLQAGTYRGSVAGADVELALESPVAGIALEFANPEVIIFHQALDQRSPDDEESPPPPSFYISSLIGFLTPEEAAKEPEGPPPPEHLIESDTDLDNHFDSVSVLRANAASRSWAHPHLERS